MGLDYALVLRWHWGGAWRQWLDGWRGNCSIFQITDPAGLRIFATEVLPHRPSARLLIRTISRQSSKNAEIGIFI